ncbi:MAG: GNAT family N-acetyltransferase [Anaerolineae bacterium]|jgi:ribosomal protein S18 acetylase RimI-like enzyme
MQIKTDSRQISIAGAPDIPGLIFRGFLGEADYPAMLAVIEASKQVDGLERTDSLEDVTRNYQHLQNCDPYRDMLFAEVQGEVVGYSRVWWNQTDGGKRIYSGFAFLQPEWRHKGIRRAMLRHNERRMREIAASHPQDGERWFEAWCAEEEEHWESLLVGAGYRAVRHGFQMVRPDLEDIPELPLPEGLEVHPAQADQFRAIFDAAKEAFRDSWEYSDDWWTDEGFEAWQHESTFQPELWQVAWDDDQVAGMVLNFIGHDENEEYNRQRGYTETICVRRPWRRRGLARALIARSLDVLKEQGMTEAALGVDTENQSGALRLYQSMGFRPVKRNSVYRKLMEE